MTASSLLLLDRDLFGFTALDLDDGLFVLWPLPLFGRGVRRAGLREGESVRRARSMEDMEATEASLDCLLELPAGVKFRRGDKRAISSDATQQKGRQSWIGCRLDSDTGCFSSID